MGIDKEFKGTQRPLEMKLKPIGLILPVAALISWELGVAAGALNPTFFPPPSKLLQLAVVLFLDDTLLEHFLATMGRLVPGFLIGSSFGLAFGLGLSSSIVARTFFEPSLLAIYSIPKVALLPIFLATLGVGEGALIGLVATSVFFYVWIYTMSAAMRTPKNLIITATVFGATKLRVLRDVIFRSSLPETMTGIRIGATVSLLVCLTTEYILGSTGIGYLILGSRGLGLYGHSYLGILMAAFTGIAAQQAIKKIEKRINPWSLSARQTIFRA